MSLTKGFPRRTPLARMTSPAQTAWSPRRRSLPLAVAMAASLLLGTFIAPAWAAQRGLSPTDRAARLTFAYLRGQLRCDGSFPADGDAASVAQFVIAASVAPRNVVGYDVSKVTAKPKACTGGTRPQTPMYYLQQQVPADESPADLDVSTLAEILQAEVAAPLHRTQSGEKHILAIAKFIQGQVNSNAVTSQYTFTLALEMQALDAVGKDLKNEVQSVKRLESVLRAYQVPTGIPNVNGWGYAKDASADTNSTAVVIMALDGAGIHKYDNMAATYFGCEQAPFTCPSRPGATCAGAKPNGGFQYSDGSGADVDSTANVLQALYGMKHWTVPSGMCSPAIQPAKNWLLPPRQQLDGSYLNYANAEDTFTTAQIPIALIGRTYPAARM